jgi:heme/copper-type cytochrome/quinol oxidase subunit 2
MKLLIRVAPLAIAAFIAAAPSFAQPPKAWEVIADSDNTFKVVGQKKPIITVKAGQVVKLRVTGKKGPEMDKSGAVHSLTINDLKDQGWDVPVKEGVNEYTLVAPATPGDYEIICAIKCGPGHEDMKMKLVVTK